MNKFDNELIEMGKLYLEIEEKGELSREGIQNYIQFLRDTFLVTNEIEKYLAQPIINVAINTKNEDVIKKTISNLYLVIGGFDKDEMINLLLLLNKYKNELVRMSDEEREWLKSLNLDNLFINSYIERSMLQIALTKCDFTNIKLFTQRLQETNEQLKPIQEKITWSMADVSI